MNFKENTPYIIGFLVLFLLALCAITDPVSAEESTGYYSIYGHAITGYKDNAFIFDDNSTLLLDPHNESLYLPQIIYNKTVIGKSKLLQSQSANYADALIAPSKNWSEYPQYDPANATRIKQGDYVHLGETIDIAGNGWFTGFIAYNGKYETSYNLAASENATLTRKEVSSRNLSAYYIDPEYYSDKLGWWYSDYNELSPNGYDRLFYVGAYPKVETLIEKINKKIALDKEAILTAVIKNLTAMPEKPAWNHGIIISRNVSTALSAPYQDTRYWIFTNGEQDASLYDRPLESPGMIQLARLTTANLKEGVYDIIFTQPDSLGQYEQTYNLEKHSISSPFRDTPDIIIYGRNGNAVEGMLEQQIKTSRQTNYTKWIVNIEDPKIEIKKLDAWHFGNNSLFTISGYTNMNEGSKLTVIMDANLKGDKWYGIRQWTANVTDHGGMNYYRTWNATFAVDLSGLSTGPHSMTVISDAGASATVPFYKNKDIPAHYQPLQYIEYIGNSPFIAPIYINTTIIKEVPGPVQTVIVHETPAPAEVRAAADKIAMDKTNAQAVMAVVIIAFFLVGRWAIDAYRRAKK